MLNTGELDLENMPIGGLVGKLLEKSAETELDLGSMGILGAIASKIYSLIQKILASFSF